MTCVVAEVPGKVMLAGEYSVLAGGRALAAAVDRHLVVTAEPASGLHGACRVSSNLWPEARLVQAGDTGSREPLVDAVAHAMAFYGVRDVGISVASELDVSFGVGSSSALRLGVLLALEELARWQAGGGEKRPRAELWGAAREAYTLQCAAQTTASGYDIATQLSGGVVLFTPAPADAAGKWPGDVSAAGDAAELNGVARIYVGGAGAPTGPVVRETLAWIAKNELGSALAAAADRLIAAFTKALNAPGDAAALTELARATGAHRTLLADAPHAPRSLLAALTALPGCDETWSFKTTGAGGEDALLLVGTNATLYKADAALRAVGWRPLAAPFTDCGARVCRIDDAPFDAAQEPHASEAGPHA